MINRKTLRIVLTALLAVALLSALALAEEDCDHKGYDHYYEHVFDTTREMQYAINPDHPDTHLVTGYVIGIEEYCDWCGEYLGTTTVGEVRTLSEPHTWTGETGAACVCGAQNPCRHLHARHRYEYAPEECTVVSYTEQGHVISAKVSAYITYCDECGWSYRDENFDPSAAITVTEEHDFDANGVCTVCGFECEHAATESTQYVEFREITKTDAKTHTGSAVLIKETRCKSCGCRIDFTEQEMLTPFTEVHQWDESGFCWICEAANTCRHPNMKLDSKGYIYENPVSIDAHTHQVDRRTVNWKSCPDCGYQTMEKTGEVVTVVEAHSFWNGNICEVCGAKNECTHERNVVVNDYYDEMYALSGDVSGHYIERTPYSRRTCMDCGAVVSESRGEPEIIREPHEYDENGVCWQCGFNSADCPHAHTYTEEWEDGKAYDYQAQPTQDGTGHYYLFDTYNRTFCSDCGVLLGEVKTSQTPVMGKVVPHFFNHSSVCADCGYRTECAHAHVQKDIDTSGEIYVTSGSETQHEYWRDDLYRMYCKDCGGYLAQLWSQDFVSREDHTFENGVCTVCGVKEHVCTHKTADDKSAVRDGVCLLCGKDLGDRPEDVFIYDIVNGEAVITGVNYDPADGALIVPATLDGYPVTAINSYAFNEHKAIRSVILPEGVKMIGRGAFMSCTNLETISLPESLEQIGDSAFCSCGDLKAITLPDSLELIGESAFDNCGQLRQITIPANVVSVGESAFWGCSCLERVVFEGDATQIGSWAFAYCRSLTQVALPASLTEIRGYTFSDCWLLAPEGITIPTGCTVADTAFENCPLMAECKHPNAETNGAERWIISSKAVDGISHHITYRPVTYYLCPDCGCYWGVNGDLIECDEAHFWSGERCYYCDALNECEHDFKVDSYYIEKANSESDWESPEYAYDSAEHWSETDNQIIAYSEECTKCGESRFVELDTPIPVAANTHEAHTFGADGRCIVCDYECSHSFSGDVCTNCGAHKFVIVGNRLKHYLGNDAEVVVPNGVVYIDSYEFSNNESIVSVTLPDSVAGIEGSFRNCPNLTTAVLPKNISDIAGAFLDCPNLTAYLYKGTFAEAYCIKNGIPYEYNSCTHMIAFEQDVYETTLGEGAVAVGVELTCGCETLDKTLLWNAASGSFAEGADALHALYTPAQPGVITITAGDGALLSAESRVIVHDPQRVVLPPDLTQIGEEALLGIAATEVNVPSGVTQIGAKAFRNAAQLKIVTLPAGLENIADDAFAGCDQLTLVCANAAQAAYATKQGIDFVLLETK